VNEKQFNLPSRLAAHLHNANDSARLRLTQVSLGRKKSPLLIQKPRMGNKNGIKNGFPKRCALLSPEKSKEIVNRICVVNANIKIVPAGVQGEQQIVLDMCTHIF